MCWVLYFAHNYSLFSLSLSLSISFSLSLRFPALFSFFAVGKLMEMHGEGGAGAKVSGTTYEPPVQQSV